MTTVAPAVDRVPPNDSLPIPHRVARIVKESVDCWTLWLAPVDGRKRPPFAPGQFNMLHAFGVGEAAISMSDGGDEDDCWVHTIRAVGSVTKALCKLKVGAVVGVRGPFGTPWPIEVADGRDVVLVAGGIGMAPLRPVLNAVLANRKRYGRVALLYGARTPDDLLYRKQLATWRGRFDLNVSVTVDRAQSEWLSHVGVVTKLIQHATFDPAETFAMICGPEIMMRYSAHEFSIRGVPDEQIFVSMERNMQCGVGLCGHCQYGKSFVCVDGPVFRLDAVLSRLHLREL